ncbi:MAG: HD-GYP domain-containing protein [Ruminiclostridium sp.]|nr:HD-GYP domain-containing protein [Ruminiclostridium sp.]
MRFVPINCIKAGMKTGKKLVGKNDELLLNSGVVIQQSFITKIKELGYNGIYIDDDLSEGIEIDEIINEDLKYKTVKSIKDTFAKIGKGKTDSFEYIDGFSEHLNLIVKEVLENRDAMVNIIDLKIFDDYTFYHSVNVTVLSLIVGASLGLNKSTLYNLGLAALLHDIGKVFIPKEILNKPSVFEKSEFELIKTHSEKGFQFLKDNSGIPAHSYIGVLQHHERFDGSGYPMCIEGKKISLFAKIIAVTDVYDALTSRRPYREAMTPSEAIEYIMGSGGTHFDPKMAVCFTQKVAPYPKGTCVNLSNNTMGIVVENYRDYCLRPKVKIIKENGKKTEPYYLDLCKDMSALGITITGMEDEKA